MNKIITIIGPTGIGKSKLALTIAQLFDGEVISADSRQVYRYMDIGTAKPTKQEMSVTPHHLIDIIDPDEAFGLSDYQEQCKKTIDNIIERRRLPIMAGGSGQYVWSVLENWEIPRVVPDNEYRNQLEQRARDEGQEVLFHELEKINPEAAKKVDRLNLRRVIRALEINNSAAESNKCKSVKNKPLYNSLIIGLTTERKEVYRRIDSRVDVMITNGLIDEVRGLIEKGYSSELPSMSGIGYRQIGMFLKDEISKEEAVQQMKYESHRYVRGQYNWFKLKDDRIKWFDIQCNIKTQITELVKIFLGQGF